MFNLFFFTFTSRGGENTKPATPEQSATAATQAVVVNIEALMISLDT